MGIGSTSEYIDPDGKSYITDIEIYWIDQSIWNYTFEKHYEQLSSILISFKAPYTKNEYEFYQSFSEDCTDREETMMLKDFIVSDIQVFGKFAKK